MNQILALIVLLPPLAFASECPDHLAAPGFTHYKDETEFKFDVQRGVTLRRYLSSVPRTSFATDAIAAGQLVTWWGLNVGVVASEAQARLNEAFLQAKSVGRTPYHGVQKLMYMVTPRAAEFTELAAKILKGGANEDAAREDSRARARALWRSLAPSAEFIYFADSVDGRADKLARMTLDTKDFLARFNEDAISVTSDDRGARFYVDGWTSPAKLGVVRFQNVFRRGPKGQIADKEMRHSLRKLIEFEEAGGTIRMNGDPEAALQMFANQLRAGEDHVIDPRSKEIITRSLVRESRYLEKDKLEGTRQQLRAGLAYTMEARTKSGRLVAATLTFMRGQAFDSETVAYLIRRSDYTPPTLEVPETHPDRTYYDPEHPEENYAKMALYLAVAETALLHRRAGIDIRKIGQVTGFSARAGGEWMGETEFRPIHRELHARPVPDLDFGRPFSWKTDLPFGPADVDVWLPPHNKSKTRTP